MARKKSRQTRFKLSTNHIEYLSKSQSDWYTAKATRSTSQFIRKKRRRIAEMLEETSGETIDASMKASIEEAIASWFRANCRPRGRIAKTGTKARSGREVFAHKEWKAIAERKRELMEEANFQGDQHIGFHQQAVTELWENVPEGEKAAYRREAVEWDNIAPPPEIQFHNAEAAADRFLKFTEDLYRQGNVRVWAMMIFRDKDGMLVKQVIDFNDRLGGHSRLDEAFPQEYEQTGFEKLFDKWMRPVYSFRDTPPPAEPPKATKDLARVDLDKNRYGEPILPNIDECPPGEASHRKWLTKVFRAFVFDSYSAATGGLKRDISWTRLFGNLRQFVDEYFWPDRFTSDLKDPSIMKYDVIKAILTFWYNRQLDGADPVFSFSHYEDPKKQGRWIPRVSRDVIDDDPEVEVEGEARANRQKGRVKGKGKAVRLAKTAAEKGKGKASEPVVDTPDWMESPLKRIGNAVVESGDSPPRKKKEVTRSGAGRARESGNGSAEGEVSSESDMEDDSDREDTGSGSGSKASGLKASGSKASGKGSRGMEDDSDREDTGSGSGSKASGLKASGSKASGKGSRGMEDDSDREDTGSGSGSKASGLKVSSSKASGKGSRGMEDDSDREDTGSGSAKASGLKASGSKASGKGSRGMEDDSDREDTGSGSGSKASGLKVSSSKASGKGSRGMEDDSDREDTGSGSAKASGLKASGSKASGKGSRGGKGKVKGKDAKRKASRGDSGNDSDGIAKGEEHSANAGGTASESHGQGRVQDGGERSGSGLPNRDARSGPSETHPSEDHQKEDTGHAKPTGSRRNMPTTSVGLTTRAMAKSSRVQTRSSHKTSSRPRAQARPAGGTSKTADIFDLKTRRQWGRK
ncbi:hypothetical protein CC1G_10454 [Coprinopsis cinerea okayama7|uniref:Uncharacterized protein n=1 Tax=Coprinopsis cinerea (strain Okayama-7 / 130 / ATCC MYA-4618 / FGSC 9003) TaxID=240176 RepID=A8PDU3_COPC7|nr:hypothetical protein CC1G_10454 [Coprinopsis cinerea okayama7\|eukprot:XP_001840668.2 hypothetical protein CC1G_10454 [Coprinopsis cinerea okayama7\